MWAPTYCGAEYANPAPSGAACRGARQDGRFGAALGPAFHSAPAFGRAAYLAPVFSAPPRTRLRFRVVGSNMLRSPVHKPGAEWGTAAPARGRSHPGHESVR